MVSISAYILLLILTLTWLNGSSAFSGLQWKQVPGRGATLPLGRSFQTAVAATKTESKQTLDEKQVRIDGIS